MVELRRRNEEVSRKNEQDIQALRRENEDMKKKLVEGGPSAVSTNLVGRSFTSPPNSRAIGETKDKRPSLRRWMASLVLTSRSARPVPWIWCANTLSPILSSGFHCQISGKASTGITMMTRPIQMSTWMPTLRT